MLELPVPAGPVESPDSTSHTFADSPGQALFYRALEVPVLSSLDPWALLVSAAAMVLLFAFRIGMIWTLATCCAAGIVLHLLGLIL